MQVERFATAVQAANHSRRNVLRLATAGAAVVVSSRFHVPARAQAPFPTRVRVLHAAPELGKVEVLFNGEEQLDEFDYGTTSDWIDIAPGVTRITVRRDRAGINYIVFDAIAPVVANEDYEVVLSDPLVIPIPVDRSPLAADTSRARVLHASVDVPAIDIAVKGGEVVGNDLAYGQLSEPLEVPAGNHDLEARLHGTGEVVLDLSGLTFEPEMVYQLVIYGKPEDEDAPLTMVLLGDEARAAMPQATPSA